MIRKVSVAKKRQFKGQRRNNVETEIKSLNDRIESEAPPKGTNPLSEDFSNNKDVDKGKVYYPAAKTFRDLPLSQKTLLGLESAKFIRMTDIQRAALPHALCGRDVLGAAKTGSGKTLAFLIPVIETLYRKRWTQMDGLGAIIISPTRELAYQTFKVLRTIGGRHDSLSAGLVIGGGRSVNEEKSNIGMMNILVCTPGRILQHMDETPDFRCEGLQVLVLDEADKMLEMGFKRDLNAILDFLPKERQTLLFSATQTTSIQQLARLSLKDPEFISVHAESEVTTPNKLIQNFIIIDLDKKLDFLWSFVKSHLRQKSLVFLSTQKQVRYVFEVFRAMRPGIALMHLHGKMSQKKRTEIYVAFTASQHAVLLSTDIAARGLDFKRVDWVLQLDCPESVDTYIHRVGRTARLDSGGRGLLVLLPSEEKMVDYLEQAKIPIPKLKINPKKSQTIQGSLQTLCTEKTDIKYLAQKALKSYLRSVHLSPMKDVFDVTKLPVNEFSLSLGLQGTPQIMFSEEKKVDKYNLIKKQQEEQINEALEQVGDESIIPLKLKKNFKTKEEKLLKRKNNSVFSEAWNKLKAEEEEDDDEDELLVKKKTNQTHMNLDDELVNIDEYKGNMAKEDDDDEEEDNFVEEVIEDLKEQDLEDKKVYREKKKKERLQRKLKEKKKIDYQKQKRGNNNLPLVTIGNPIGEDEEFEGKDHYSSDEGELEGEDIDNQDIEGEDDERGFEGEIDENEEIEGNFDKEESKEELLVDEVNDENKPAIKERKRKRSVDDEGDREVKKTRINQKNFV